jgi:hypothetical protein
MVIDFEQGFRKESITSFEMPKTLHLPSSNESYYILLGVGVRRITIFKFPVYVFGFYIGKESFDHLLSYMSLNPQISDGELLDMVIEGDYECIFEIGRTFLFT